MGKHLSVILFFFIIHSFFSRTFGQNTVPHHKFITTEDGLPSNRIYHTMQDKEGYIWIATDNGVARYNGKEFKHYPAPESIDNEYSHFVELKDGSIWCVNFGNQVLQVSGDSLKICEWAKPFMGDAKYYSLTSWRDSLLFLHNPNRIAQHDPFTGRTKTIKKSGQEALKGFSACEEFISFKNNEKFSKDRITTIHSYDPISGKINQRKIKKEYNHLNNAFSYGKNIGLFNRYHLHEGKNIQVNLLEINKELQTISKAQLKNYNHSKGKQINHISRIDSTYWFCTTTGLFKYDESQEILFPEYSITNILRDFEGNTWISTYDNGLIFIPFLKMKKHTLFPFPISHIKHWDDGYMIASSSTGRLMGYDTKSLTLKFNRTIGDASSMQFEFFGKNEILAYINRPYKVSLFTGLDIPFHEGIDGLNVKQIGKIDDKIFYFNVNKNKIIAVNHTGNKIGRYEFNSLWTKVSLSKNSYRYALDRQKAGFRFEQVFFDKTHHMFWFSSPENSYFELGDSINLFDPGLKDNGSLSCFANLDDGRIVAGKNDSGFIIINDMKTEKVIDNPIFKSLGKIVKISVEKNRIAALTEKGIIVSDKEGNISHIIDESDLLSPASIYDISLKNGILWMGRNDGLYSLDLNAYREIYTSPILHINSIKINDMPFSIENAPSKIEHSSDIEIILNSNVFKSREGLEYHYRLKKEDDWNTVTGENKSIRLSNLARGKYDFSIFSVNGEGNKSELKNYSFRVRPPFWLQGWFILGGLGIFFLIGYFINRREVQTLKRENDLQNEIRLNKLSALQARMNPHFIFNSLNSIQDFIIRLDTEGANEYLGLFSDLMRTYLKHSEKEYIWLQEEIEALETYLKLEQMRFEDVEINLNIDEILYEYDIVIPPLMIQPYVENAFKHGLLHKKENKRLNIEFSFSEKQHAMLVTVKDNGVGREYLEKIQSNGLSFSSTANENRLKLLNHNRKQKLTVMIEDLKLQGIPGGTLVTIKIPLNIETTEK